MNVCARDMSPVCIYIKTRGANVTALLFAVSDAKLTALFHSLLAVTL